ncbi:Helix-turn-helix domain-containing protein [Lachnospiraceae bacterium YSD2013]|nr:Helix-turn-helix domain-containing protein [Lachnospiraceae bacterium YSD2013]
MADKKSIMLSEEQLNFIKKASAGKNLLVDASEGCGKTTALIELCDRLPGRKKILFFAVDRPSRNEIEDEIGKRNVAVSYFRGFAFKELKKLGVYGETYELLDLFAKARPNVSGYDILIVDEFQFIDAEASAMLRIIKSQCDNLQVIFAGNTENKFYDKSRFDAKIFAGELLGEHEEIHFKNCYEIPMYSGAEKKSNVREGIDDFNDDDNEMGLPEEYATEPESPVREMVSYLGDGVPIAVVDAELNNNNEVMSVGAVIADPDTYKIKDERYYIITPENLAGGIFLKELRTGDCLNAPAVSREEAMDKIAFFLRDSNVRSIYAYNAAFDRDMLPELCEFAWYDIMQLAAYKQHNPAIGPGESCNKEGRLKRDFGVGAMIRRMSGDVSFTETHNALYDARDELKIMELLGRPLSDYDFTLVDGSLSDDGEDSPLTIESINDVVLEEDAISASEAEIMLNVSRNTIYKLIKKGVIFGFKRDNRYIISRRSVEEYLLEIESREAKKYRKAMTGILIVLLGALILLWHLAATFY